MSYDGAGSLFALGLRVTKLNADGSPMVGANTCYTTDAMVSMELGMDYTKPDIVQQINGSAVICVAYQAPASLTGGHIASLQLCTPDPILVSMLAGGNIFADGSGNQVGYQAPPLGVDPTPNGISIELWTSAIINGAKAVNDPYFWWVLPRCYVTFGQNMKLEAQNPALPEFDGTTQQNPNWTSGPDGLWVYDSSRIWQYARVPSMPDLSPGYKVVNPPVTVSSIALTPSPVPLHVDTNVQITATATMSDSSTRDVTLLAQWTSSNQTDVIVSDTGVANGIAVGTATVTASYGGKTGTVTANVT